MVCHRMYQTVRVSGRLQGYSNHNCIPIFNRSSSVMQERKTPSLHPVTLPVIVPWVESVQVEFHLVADLGLILFVLLCNPTFLRHLAASGHLLAASCKYQNKNLNGWSNLHNQNIIFCYWVIQFTYDEVFVCLFQCSLRLAKQPETSKWQPPARSYVRRRLKGEKACSISWQRNCCLIYCEQFIHPLFPRTLLTVYPPGIVTLKN